MSARLETLKTTLQARLGSRLIGMDEILREVRLEVSAANYLEVMQALRDTPELAFAGLMDLCGVDYATYGGEKGENRPARRFAVVTHLLSIQHNWRVRVRVFAEDDGAPRLPSLFHIWNSANWYEREAFDMFGIFFDGHPDLRRILTDYGFVGHPFRKDFPVCGHLEMRYDPEQKRVVYQPVSIEPREITPRIRREANWGREHA
ncbi:MAG: NADH-quinone oxidoreductase subunit C [Zoogloeaceae bacterium]|jgi:NADH-quinone oxidoreductase subunit C|nr:NADH-quinone oxidoreductase subunit C [Zoogloeaceae bacterium]